MKSWALCLAALASAWLVTLRAAAPTANGAEAPRPWSSTLLQDAAAWPHSEKDARISVTPQGLRLEVAEARKNAFAVMSGLALPKDLGRIRVRVAGVGDNARWSLRLYGELREPGRRHTVSVAESETSTGEHAFDLDPRLYVVTSSPVQLQLIVEGPPGAFAMFAEVAFLPAPKRANRAPRTHFQPGQKDIPAVEWMPNLPEPYKLLDWREKARAYDRFVFDFNAQGEFLPLIWLDESHLNNDHPTFGLPSYVGTPAQARGKTNSQEGITCMGAVLGATLAGVDKRRQAQDYVTMCESWFNTRNGMNLVLNRQQEGGGGSFWYELYPHIVFYALADRYPEQPRFREIMRTTAERWRQACLDLTASNGLPDFNHLSFNFRTRKAVDNRQWREPDAAAGVAWLQYAAWMAFHDSNHLAAADDCVKFLQSQSRNPYYEVLLPYGTLTAARLNAELGRNYDVDRLLAWCFGISDTRGGWGVTLGNWGGYDCDGLVGSVDNRGGYAFAMNTFAQAGALMPLARYDPRYSRAIGKWMLNLANSARLFYPGELPPGHESSAFWKGDPKHVIAYEGLRYAWEGKSPCATGDPVAMKWGPKTDLGLYGSSYVGMLGAIVRPTSDPRILQLDCLATDFFHAPAWPTYLCYNPYPARRSFAFTVGPAASDLYDAVTGTFLKRNVRNQTNLTIPADSAALIVVAPAGGKLTHDGARTLINGVVVNWREAFAPAKRNP
jgi:hypothetical protein